MKRAFVAFLSAIVLVTPALAQKKPAVDRVQVTDFLAEAIAVDSVCDGLQVHMEYLFVVLQRSKISLDEILPEAGAKSVSYMAGFAEDGVPQVCARGAEYFGPEGSKFPNMLTLQ